MTDPRPATPVAPGEGCAGVGVEDIRVVARESLTRSRLDVRIVTDPPLACPVCGGEFDTWEVNVAGFTHVVGAPPGSS